jgi:hypothetical protein
MKKAFAVHFLFGAFLLWRTKKHFSFIYSPKPQIQLALENFLLNR